MEREIKKLRFEVTSRLYDLHKEKFDGNNVHLAEAAGCSESTLRNIFVKLTDKNKGQDITLSMAFKLCNALDVELSDLVKGLYLSKNSEKKKAK